LPIAVGDLKLTPQVTSVFNRNYNTKLEMGDVEFLAGLSAGYKVSDAVSISLNGAYGSISNENSLVGVYGGTVRSGNNSSTSSTTAKSIGADTTYNNPEDADPPVTVTTITDTIKTTTSDTKYISNGLIAGIGATIKAGPGVIALGVSYGNASNSADKYRSELTTTTTTTIVRVSENDVDFSDPDITKSDPVIIDTKDFDPKTATNKNDILIDLRYTWNVHPKFSIAPRWRTYITTYDEGSGHVKMKMENRPEIVLTGTF
jgi:hypothetical protein